MPVEIVFRQGCLAEIPTRVQALGSRPMLVTGLRSIKASGVLDRVLPSLRPMAVFRADENPSDETCDRGAQLCRQHACDCIVAIGGGSAIDVAKAIAGLALNDGSCSQFFGADKFVRGALPIIAAPTTAGTGSEVTQYAVITNSSERAKRTISGRCLFPTTALLDPELTVTMPASTTAYTGLDALSQAMEGYLSKKSTLLGDELALAACRIVREWLPRAIANGTDIEARWRMLYAAMLSGCVIAQSGTTLVHGMGYYFTLECGIPHGLSNGLLLTPVFQFNASVAADRVAALSAALGYPVKANEDDARIAIGRALHSLLHACGVSPAARDYGVRQDQLDEFATHIMSEPYRFRNQIGDVSRDHVLHFFKHAFDGESE